MRSRWIRVLVAASAISSLTASLPAAQLAVTVIPPADLAIPRYLPFELKLRHSTPYANPFWDVSVAATFTSPGGASYSVEGFYYDSIDWMVRFAPLIEGPWTYSVNMSAAGGTFATSGGFTCIPSPLHGPLRVDPDNPERLLRDDGTSFNAIGTNFFAWDRPSIDGNWTAPPDSELDERWAVYFETYRQRGGNAWRRILGNEGAGEIEPFGGQIGIWHDSGPDRYDLTRARAIDVEFREAREHDMAVIAALLGAQRSWDRNPLNACNGGPFPAPDGNCGSHTGYPDDFLGANALSIAYHRKYFRYMVARYSAFVDVWELFNEFDEADESDDPRAHGLTPAWKAAMANLVRSAHPYHDLVATTRTRNASSVADAWQDLHVAHCYSYSSAADMCLHGCLADPTVCARGVDALLATLPRHAGKPDLVDEFGFTHDIANDDPDHHRIGVWTALHLDTGILFWDANTRIDCESPLNCPAQTVTSAYIGESTRSYILGRQRYAALLPHTMRAAATPPAISPSRVLRVFALEDPLAGMYSAYVHRFDDHDAVTSAARITVDGLSNEPHEGVWIDPNAGVPRSSFFFSGTHLSATFPPFLEDCALLVRPSSPVEILTTSLPEPVERAPNYFMLEARGGARPYTWRIVSGALPVGMVLDSGSGMISGTPRYGGSNRFTVEVTARPLATGGPSSTDQMPLAIRWTRSFESIASQDGFILESEPGSRVGGIVYDAIGTEFGLGAGDHGGNERVVTLLSFDTSSIPDGAVVDSARVVLVCNDAIRANPLPLGPLHLDVRRGVFGPSAGLEPADFQAPATALSAATNPLFGTLDQLPPWPWTLTMNLDAAGRGAVNAQGFTQCRVYLDIPTDGDGVTDALCFCPGGYADAALRPRLVVTYH